MITSIDQLYSALQEIVSTASGIPLDRVILADQGRPPPSGTELYATYRPIPVRAYGQPRKERSVNGDEFDEMTVTAMEMMVSVNFLNGAARDAAWRLHNANHREPIRQLLWDNDIGWRYVSEIRRLTEIDQAGFQPRYQADIHIFAETYIEDSVLRASSVSITIEDRQGNTLYDQQVTA